MNVNDVNSQKVNLNDWWNEGWTDRTPKKNGESIFKTESQVALNDWWDEGWTKTPTV